MILYDKECNLLGMSKSILDFLGYEDIEEFKTYTNDVADLFQNRSGYIHRFKNFSWINYVLHSGAPNKNAILFLKNGKEAEVKIVIEEIISLENGPEGLYYSVSLHPTHVGLSSAPLKAQKVEPLDEPSKEVSFSSDQEDLPSGILEKSFHESDESSLFIKDSEEESLEDHLKEDEPKDLEIDFEDFNIQTDTESEISFTTDQYEKPSILEQDSVPFSLQQELEPYDFQLALDALEIEPEELEAFLQEYCDHVEMVAIALEDAISQNDDIAKKALLSQLKGASEHLRIKRIVQLIDTLYETNDATALDDLQAYAHFLKSTHIKY